MPEADEAIFFVGGGHVIDQARDDGGDGPGSAGQGGAAGEETLERVVEERQAEGAQEDASG